MKEIQTLNHSGHEFASLMFGLFGLFFPLASKEANGISFILFLHGKMNGQNSVLDIVCDFSCFFTL